MTTSPRSGMYCVGLFVIINIKTVITTHMLHAHISFFPLQQTHKLSLFLSLHNITFIFVIIYSIVIVKFDATKRKLLEYLCLLSNKLTT